MSPLDRMSDPMWRLTHLYKIRDKGTGKVVEFQPNPQQRDVLESLLGGCRRIVVLKARQLGMSTLMCIYMIDQMLWNSGWQGTIIDRNANSAALKLNTITKLALENLAPELASRVTILRSSDTILEVSVDGDTPSTIHAATHARGGTYNMLLVSEWGVIQHEDPKRSEEILSGALPSAETGTIVVETTWRGPLGSGGLARIIRNARDNPIPQAGPMDWKILFFPWWRDPLYTAQGDPSTIIEHNARYLMKLEQNLGITLSDGQKIWYNAKERELGESVLREYPSTMEECWQVPFKGAILAKQVSEARTAGRIRHLEYDRSHPLYTFWDIGSPPNTVIWFIQLIAGEIRVIDVLRGGFESLGELVGNLIAMGYLYTQHFLPHDAGSTKTSGLSFQQELRRCGLSNTRTVPRTQDIEIGLGQLRSLFPRMIFNSSRTADGIEALECYRYSDDNHPHHDGNSHYADALRCLAEAQTRGMIVAEGWIPAEYFRRKNRPTRANMGQRDEW